MDIIEVAARRASRPTSIEGWEPDDDTPDGWQPIEVPLADEREQGGVRNLVAYPPGEGQIVALMTTTASFTTVQERVSGAVNFLASVLSEADHSYLVARLFDGRDDFGGSHCMKIMEGLIEEWSGRPTVKPSGSASPRRTSGRSSTRATRAVTS